MRPSLTVWSTDEWPGRVADLIADRLAATPRLRVVLPTGSTPLPVYDRLPAALARRGVSAADATVIVLDEFVGLPAGHVARCDEVLRKRVVDQLHPSPRLIAFDVDGVDPIEACERLEEEIRTLGGPDLVVLGLGTNGHIGMNEPGSAADARSRHVALAPSTIEAARGYGADPPPTHGVTLGLGTIAEAPEIWLLVTGERKRDILAAVLHGPVTPDVPGSLLRQHPGLRVLTDEAAAPH